MREPIEQAEFADRVGDIDVGAKIGRDVARAQHAARAGRDRLLQDFHAAFRMARHDDGQQARPRLADATMRLDDRRFLARMGRGGDEDLALADCVLHFGELGRDRPAAPGRRA